MGMMFYKECLRLTQQHKNNYDSSKVLSGLGSVITNIKGDYILGERHYRNALRIRQNGPAVKDCSLAFLYQSLGWNLGCQGKSQEAIV
uniref:Tetratricopeptide repeat protein 28 n=1 Tax=Magallana gigas TaxID=29159 RepID=K1PW93_MAGGI